MKYMIMHKMTKAMDQGVPPTPEEMQRIGKLMGEASQAGAFISGEGLKPTSERLLVVYKSGKRTVTKGPFPNAKELAGGYVLLRVKSQEEALSWLDRIGAAVQDLELFLGPVVEPWDMGMGDKPNDAPSRFLAVYNVDASTGEPSTDKEIARALDGVRQEMTAAGVLQESAVLAPPRDGARLRYDTGKVRVIDGPFAESKELIAGYAIFKAGSKEEAIDWGIRFGDVVGVEEIDVRLVRE